MTRDEACDNCDPIRSREEVRARLAVGKTRSFELMREIPGTFKLGRLWRVRERDLSAWIAQQVNRAHRDPAGPRLLTFEAAMQSAYHPMQYAPPRGVEIDMPQAQVNEIALGIGRAVQAHSEILALAKAQGDGGIRTMTSEQFGNRAIANLALALDLDPGALKLIREEIELAFDIGEREAWKRAYEANSAPFVPPACECSRADRCDNCHQPMTDPHPVYENDPDTVVCSERCMLELKAHDAERWAHTGQERG